jgi:hypothetical protein
MDYLLGNFEFVNNCNFGCFEYRFRAAFVRLIYRELIKVYWGQYDCRIFASLLHLVIPNLFFFMGQSFLLLLLSQENISGWFITVILLLFVQSMVSSFTNDTDNQYIAGLLDPLVARHYLIILNIDCCRKKHKLAPV